MDVVPKRFGKYGLTTHPDKTKLISFRRPPHRVGKRSDQGSQRPGTFDLLGFTHYWSKSRKGYWVIKQKTATDRFSRAVRSIDTWCRFNRHLPIGEQQQKLNEKLRGHYAYYGVTGNSRALSQFRTLVEIRWGKWLNRRNRRRPLNWERFHRFLRRYPLAPAVSVRSMYRRAAT